jgi:tetratricopeptide (TPR) repeat protein
MSRRYLTSRRTWSLIAALVITIVQVGAAEQLPMSEVLNQGIHFGDWSKTQSLCNQILQKSPDDADALVSRARIRALLGKTNDAISDCDKVLATRPRFALALRTRGAALCDIGKTQAGQTDLRLYLALTQSAHDSDTRYRRAGAFEFLRDDESAKSEYQSIVNETGSATLAKDIFNRGFALTQLMKFKEAIETFTRLKHKYPAAPLVAACLAYCHLENGDSVLALKEFAEAAAEAPDFFANQGGWGWALEKLKKYDEAIRHYDRALQTEGHYLFALRHRGYCHLIQQDYNSALKDLSKAITIEPDDTNTILNRAQAYSHLLQYKEAIDACNRVIALDPKSDDAYFARGLVFRDEKQYAKSIADFSKAIKLNPKDAMYFCARGCAEVRNSNYREAIEDCNRSIQLNPDRTHPHLSRGEAYSALGCYDLALRDLTVVIAKDPSSIEALTDRAGVYQKLNKTKLADLDLARSRQLKQTGPRPQ